MFVMGLPAAQNADGGARQASALGSCDGAWQLKGPGSAPLPRPSLHMARCMSFQGFCRAALPLAIQLWARSFLDPVCKSGGWRYLMKLVGRALVAERGNGVH
jgi:hypothetical protein